MRQCCREGGRLLRIAHTRHCPPPLHPIAAGVSTLADGRVAVIGGVKLAGYAGYGAKDVKNNNPAYEIYDPVSG